MRFEVDAHGFHWVARVTLPSWAQGGAPDFTSDGTVDLVFAPEGRDTEPLTPDELALARWVPDNERALADAAHAAILAEYPDLQQSYGYVGEERAHFMPDVAGVADLRRLVVLRTVHVHQIDRDGLPYVGLEFDCSWDEEHGLGVLMHGTRAVKVGGADTAILLWIAQDDAAAG